MTEALFQTDVALREEGRDILEGRGLRALIEEYAPVHVMGSHRLELMVWRDLDLAMDAPDITVAQFFDLGNRITELLSPWKMFFTDNRTHDGGRDPKGLYWGIRLGDLRSGAWKIDLWAFSSEDCADKIHHRDALMNRLIPENRAPILQIKTDIWNHPQYRDTVTSQDVYDAVLDHGVQTTTDFWKYINEKRES